MKDKSKDFESYERWRGRDNFGRTNERRYDKSNVECFNSHKYGHFSWECKANIECYNYHKYGHFLGSVNPMLKKKLILLMRKKMKSQHYCYHLIMKRIMKSACGILTMAQVITCAVTRRKLWSLKKRWREMFPLVILPRWKSKGNVPF